MRMLQTYAINNGGGAYDFINWRLYYWRQAGDEVLRFLIDHS